MHARGAIHLHSTFSHDGTLTLAELAAWYRRYNYQFIAVTEHAEDLDEQTAQKLFEQSRELSCDGFCVIPGVEFSCRESHILGIGAVAPAGCTDALEATRKIHRCGGMAVLAHPGRFGWRCPAEVLRVVDAVEIWNVGYDGKYLPSPLAPAGYAAMKRIQSQLLAVAGQDLHRLDSFYDVALEMDVSVFSVAAILDNLLKGRYAIASRFFRAGPDGRIDGPRTAFLRVFSPPLSAVRRARSLVSGLLA